MSTGNEKETLEVMEIMYILTCFNRSDQVCTATPNIIYFFLKRVPGNVLNITLSEHKPLITLQVLPVVSFTVKHCFTIFFDRLTLHKHTTDAFNKNSNSFPCQLCCHQSMQCANLCVI